MANNLYLHRFLSPLLIGFTKRHWIMKWCFLCSSFLFFWYQFPHWQYYNNIFNKGKQKPHSLPFYSSCPMAFAFECGYKCVMGCLNNAFISLSIIFFSVLIFQIVSAPETLSFGQLSMQFSCLDCMYVQSFTQSDWMYTDTCDHMEITRLQNLPT